MVALGLNKRIRDGRIEHVLQIYEKTISVSYLYLAPTARVHKETLLKKYKL